MGELVDFFLRSRNFILFVLLEVLCFYFIINTSNYWGVTYFNTSNRYAAQILAWSNAANQYASLRQVNADLALENQQLHARLTKLLQSKPAAPAEYQADSAFADRFKFTVAKVVNNTTQFANNYITIDKGTDDGIRPGMGVISPTGVVGKVKVCNQHFSVITSILHSEFLVSSKLVKAGEIGSAKWDGVDPHLIKLDAIPRYKPVAKGDSVVTSEFNSTFPPGILVGRVRTVGVQPNQTFHDLTLNLATNFSNLSFVYVVENRLRADQDQLEKQVETEK
ncbi:MULTISPECIES: rod shape-determining protein MreC [unclassified Spirosoma]|uniref:rod shape-determining protein MreC n=1 Tax=unclassified Spirosoma TaxID=2621999 RepID=UPI00095925CC|nr:MULTISPECIES: rod shape-determining protein MreC [unclassified Spirosoma]MBN8824838.1 rod shape-determining protein MreC [Spirosoma sp.]OJW77013.1 MAG: rod shape-determining protein MreC [Spirosoma sp. 48-14]